MKQYFCAKTGALCCTIWLLRAVSMSQTEWWSLGDTWLTLYHDPGHKTSLLLLCWLLLLQCNAVTEHMLLLLLQYITRTVITCINAYSSSPVSSPQVWPVMKPWLATILSCALLMTLPTPTLSFHCTGNMPDMITSQYILIQPHPLACPGHTPGPALVTAWS